MKILTAAPTLLFQGPLIATAFTNGYHWAGGPVGISSEVLPFIYCAFLSVFPLLHLHHIMGCLFACLQTAAPHVDGRVYYQGKCGCSDVSGEHQWRRSPSGTVTRARTHTFQITVMNLKSKFFANQFFQKFLDRSQLFSCRSDAGTCPFFWPYINSSRRCFCSFHICCLKVNEVLIPQLSFVSLFFPSPSRNDLVAPERQDGVSNWLCVQVTLSNFKQRSITPARRAKVGTTQWRKENVSHLRKLTTAVQ